MYDEFDGGSRTRPVQRWLLVALAVVVGLTALGAGGAVLLQRHRVTQANTKAVKYGLASSTKHVSVTARCAGAVHAYYDTKSPLQTGIPPRAVTVLAPKVCALAVQEGRVRPDGTMSYDDMANATSEVMSRFGVARVQTLVFTELAIAPYHLARRGSVTRRDRCVAMGYSG